MTRMCHPEEQPKDLANEREILRFAQNDSFAVTFGTLNLRAVVQDSVNPSQLGPPVIPKGRGWGKRLI